MGDKLEENSSDTTKNGYQPPATQADLDRIIADRVSRERAKYSNYDELKAKADQFDKVEEAQKTEVQKLQDRLTAAESEAAELKTAQHRAELIATIAAETGVDAKAIRGSNETEIREHANLLKTLIDVNAGPPKKTAPYTPSDGSGGADTGGSTKESFVETMSQLLN